MAYVDGFVMAVPTANKQAFADHARGAVPIFKDYGAISVTECWGDDVPEGEVTSFPMAVKRQADETVVFSWIVWPSKEVRDAAMGKMMADPRFAELGDMPFDGKRMIMGGFQPLVEG